MTTMMKSGSAIFNPHAKRIMLAHGGGGQLMDDLLSEVVRPRLTNELLKTMDDAAVVPVSKGHIAFTTDSYVVQPLEFPGGDIGRLAVSGTVNDLAVCGAVPQFISLSLILEEGLDIELLRRVLDSVAETAKEAGVHVVTGDTKVVARGQADGMYINTAGIGHIRARRSFGIDRIQPDDVVIVNGSIAEHGLSVMLQRDDQASIESELKSDVAPLNGLIAHLLDNVSGVVFMRDATRGGLSGVLADLAEHSGYLLTVDEAEIPLRPETNYAAEMLGLDPLDVANEGKVVVVVRKNKAAAALRVMKEHPLGREAAIIGHFSEERDGLCELITEVGGRRIIQKPYGEELPRIC
ncbi:MAG TPA: hydrogenase expression/formation protein HypE [Phycisphaeraceae bacterium]|nr:hydrogenase expression/formation protein HypE [Phycisphaeraceae bacterium]